IEPAGLKCGDQVVGAIDLAISTLGVPADVAKGIPPVGGAENGTAKVGNAAHLGRAQGHDTIEAEQTLVAALNPVGLPSAVMRREHYGANDRVQPGGVTASGRDGNAHRSL